MLLKGALERHEVKLEEKIACEIIDAFNKVGSAYKMRELLYSDIDESRSFLRVFKIISIWYVHYGKEIFCYLFSFENLSQNLIIVYKRSMVISSD